MAHHLSRSPWALLATVWLGVLGSGSVEAQSVDVFPFYADFEGSDDGFTVGGVDPTWERGTPSGSFVDRAAHGNEAWATSLAGDYAMFENSWLESPVFDFTSLGTDPWLKFSNAFRVQSASDYKLEISLDGGAFSVLRGSAPSESWYSSFNGWNFPLVSTEALSGPYVTSRRQLVGTAGRTVQLRWRLQAFSESTDGIGVDDVTVFDVLTDLTPWRVAAPASGLLSNAETMYLNVTNAGTETVNGFTLTMDVDGPIDDFLVRNYASPVLPFQEVLLSSPRPVDFSAPGEYTVTLTVSSANDQIAGNDVHVAKIVSQPLIDTLPWFADFEQDAGGCASTGSWERGVPQGSVITAAAAGSKAFVTHLAGSPPTSEIGRLVLPPLDLSSASDDPVLRFQAAFAPHMGQRELEMSLDGGPFEQLGGPSQTGSSGFYDAPLDGVWRPVEQILIGAAGHVAVVRVGLVRGLFGSATDGMAIDQVSVTDAGWGLGQRPRESQAMLTVNDCVEALGFGPAALNPGPYFSVVSVGSETFDLEVSGAPLQPVVLFGGTLAPALLDLGPVGQVDVASAVLFASGLSTQGFGPFFVTGPDGSMTFSVTVPLSLAGTVTTFQAVVGSPAPPARLSNAVQVVFLP